MLTPARPCCHCLDHAHVAAIIRQKGARDESAELAATTICYQHHVGSSRALPEPRQAAAAGSCLKDTGKEIRCNRHYAGLHFFCIHCSFATMVFDWLGPYTTLTYGCLFDWPVSSSSSAAKTQTRFFLLGSGQASRLRAFQVDSSTADERETLALFSRIRRTLASKVLRFDSTFSSSSAKPVVP